MKIEKMGDIETSEMVKSLIFGPPGTGKTLLSCLAPKPLVINCEGGLLCLDKFKHHPEVRDIDVMTPKTIKDIQEVWDDLYENKLTYETVILDSLSEIQKMSLDEILEDPKRKGDKDDATLKDYSKNTVQIRKLVRAFRDLDINVVMTCLDMESKDEHDGTLRIMPALTPKLSVEVMGYMDTVGYLMASQDAEGKPVRKLLTQPWGKYQAKDRSGKLGMGMTNPTMYDLANRINGVEIPEFVNKIKKELNQQ